MFDIQGLHSTAIVYSDTIDSKALEQIRVLCGQDFTRGCKIRIMPDYHYGAGCTIGFTANLGSKVVPNLVGVDIGCGMLTVNLGKIDLDLEKLDSVINSYIPHGFDSHKSAVQPFSEIPELKDKLECFSEIPNKKEYYTQVGTLGGGNHFIEIDKDDDDNLYLVIHSGSRNLGLQVATYYQNLAIEDCKGTISHEEAQAQLIEKLKKEGKQSKIQNELKKLKERLEKVQPKYPKELCFLEGDHRQKYLDDMSTVQDYAEINRETMADIILTNMGLGELSGKDWFHTVHNYIDIYDNIIRKGAVQAYKNQRLLIPMNMKDGSLLCIGKGNPDWNFSAPHGAGRIMSRGKAKGELNLEEFKESMDGIYSTTVKQSTLDESPMAYKPMDEIIRNISDTVEIVKIIKPIYNFKSS